MIFSVLLALVAPTVAPPMVRLDPDDRWALVTGLKRQVGGRFILTGLQDGDRSCRQARACTSGQELSNNAETAQARTVGDLISRARVYGEQPVAIVSLRGVSAVNPSTAKVMFAVFDAQQGRWSEKVAILSLRAGTPGYSNGWRYLTDWEDNANATDKSQL